MATVNFSVPDELKQAFDDAFRRENKSAVIAACMRAAVQEKHRQKRREQLFRSLTDRRSRRPVVEEPLLHEARKTGRA